MPLMYLEYMRIIEKGMQKTFGSWGCPKPLILHEGSLIIIHKFFL